MPQYKLPKRYKKVYHLTDPLLGILSLRGSNSLNRGTNKLMRVHNSCVLYNLCSFVHLIVTRIGGGGSLHEGGDVWHGPHVPQLGYEPSIIPV